MVCDFSQPEGACQADDAAQRAFQQAFQLCRASTCGVSSAVRDIRDQLLGAATMSIRAVLLLGLLGGCSPATSQNAVTSPCVNHDGNFTNRGEIKMHKCATLAIKALSEVCSGTVPGKHCRNESERRNHKWDLASRIPVALCWSSGGRTPVIVVQ